MAITKDICLLDIEPSVAGFITIRVVFWIQVTAGFPNTGATSAYPNIQTDPNTSGILTAIQAGTVIEEVYTFQFPQSWVAGEWSTAIEPLLLAYLTARKAWRAGTQGTIPDPGLKFAILHDSSSGWSA
jgi:hypothetical protein